MLVTLNISITPMQSNLESTLGKAIKQLMRISTVQELQFMRDKSNNQYLLITIKPTSTDVHDIQDNIYKLAALLAVHFIPTWFAPTNQTPYGMNLGVYAYDYEPFDVVSFRFPQAQNA